MISEHPLVLAPNPQPSEVLRLLEKYPPRLPRYAYGTAGFRYDATVMDAVLVRVAVFCAWWYPRLQQQSQGANTIGIMVTASHNDESYNGVKLVEANGEILADPVIQGQLTDWVNSDCPENAGKNKHPIRQWLEGKSTTAIDAPTCIIHVGYDTRSHSLPLTELAIKAIRALCGQVLNHGVATTPLLHHVVFHHNPHRVPSMIPIRPDGVGYFHLLAYSYYALLRTATSATVTSPKRLVVDCACGVGYPSLQVFSKTLQSILPATQPSPCPSSTFQGINGPGHGPLNENCGSEHVQKSNAIPKWYQAEGTVMDESSSSWEYSAAFDGDADRIVFFSSNNNDNNFFLLDGDKIAVLLCDFMQREVAALEQEVAAQSSATSLGNLRLGAVQTAYANGASTKYLKVRMKKRNVRLLQELPVAISFFKFISLFLSQTDTTLFIITNRLCWGKRMFSLPKRASSMSITQPRPLTLESTLKPMDTVR